MVTTVTEQQVPPGPCHNRSPGVNNTTRFCELLAGHAGAHKAGSLIWMYGHHDRYGPAYHHLIVQLATPPLGWYTFGSHAHVRGDELEFWGDDGTGLPIWERPRQGVDEVHLLLHREGRTPCHLFWESGMRTTDNPYLLDAVTCYRCREAMGI
jgi:hypothetical protein